MPTKFRTRTHGTIRQRGKKFPLLEKKKLPKLRITAYPHKRASQWFEDSVTDNTGNAVRGSKTMRSGLHLEAYPVPGEKGFEYRIIDPKGIADYDSIFESGYPGKHARTLTQAMKWAENTADETRAKIRGGGKVMEEMSGLHYRAGERPYGGKVKPKKYYVRATVDVQECYRKKGSPVYDANYAEHQISDMLRYDDGKIVAKKDLGNKVIFEIASDRFTPRRWASFGRNIKAEGCLEKERTQGVTI